MVLTRNELISSLQNEVRILLHLAGKVDRAKLDYRPTAKQRSTLELLQYLSMMGPQLIVVTKSGAFDEAAWMAAEGTATKRGFDETLEVIAAQADLYAKEIGGLSDDDLRSEIEVFGQKASRGAFLVAWLLSGCAAYRTQLFMYLKACGREELNTMNLWAGMDPQPAD